MLGLRVVLALVLVVLLELAVGVSMNELYRLFNIHAKRLKGEAFSCGEPQKRALSLREIVGDEEFEQYKKDIGKITPSGSILYRCQNSGCCEKYDETCQAVSEDVLKLGFMLTATRTIRFFSVNGTNHTRCACQKNNHSNIK